MPIRLILLGLIEQGANRQQAMDFLMRQGMRRGEVLCLFAAEGIDFPQPLNKDDHNPSPERIWELQELSLTC